MANEQHKSEQKSDQAEAVESVFKLRDLSRLTFRLDAGQELDAWSSTAVQFQAYVQRIVKRIENVDTDVWSPFERLDFLNSLWNYCAKKHYHFPFMLKPVEQPVETPESIQETKKA